MEIKVESENIKITIGEQVFELSRADAKVLRDALNKELGDMGVKIIKVPQECEKDHQNIPYTPIWPTSPSIPNYPRPYDIWCSSMTKTYDSSYEEDKGKNWD